MSCLGAERLAVGLLIAALDEDDARAAELLTGYDADELAHAVHHLVVGWALAYAGLRGDDARPNAHSYALHLAHLDEDEVVP